VDLVFSGRKAILDRIALLSNLRQVDFRHPLVRDSVINERNSIQLEGYRRVKKPNETITNSPGRNLHGFGSSPRSRVRRWWVKSPSGVMNSYPYGDVVCGDALSVMSYLHDESVDLVFMDPPFNLGKAYGHRGKDADRLLDERYFAYMKTVLEKAVELLRPGGALYLYHLPRWAIRFGDLLNQHLTFRHWIAISMKNNFVRGQYLYPAHYALLYYTKGSPAQFRRPKIRPWRCRHCNNYVKDYGGYKSFIERGINLSDIWDDVSPVRHKKYKYTDSNQLPPEIAQRVMEISGIPKGLFLDPFAGAGTMVVAAMTRRMRFVAADRELQHCKIINRRILEHLDRN